MENLIRIMNNFHTADEFAYAKLLMILAKGDIKVVEQLVNIIGNKELVDEFAMNTFVSKHNNKKQYYVFAENNAVYFKKID